MIILAKRSVGEDDEVESQLLRTARRQSRDRYGGGAGKFLNLSRQFTVLSKDRRSDALEKWRKLVAERFTLLSLAARSARTIQSLR